jgi:hypothetical protein
MTFRCLDHATFRGGVNSTSSAVFLPCRYPYPLRPLSIEGRGGLSPAMLCFTHAAHGNLQRSEIVSAFNPAAREKSDQRRCPIEDQVAQAIAVR